MVSPGQSSKDGICILDILKIKKPVASSCFSNYQINTIFEVWQRFVQQYYDANNLQLSLELVKIINAARTAKQKHELLRMNTNSGLDRKQAALYVHENEWVMEESSPTPFVSYIRKFPKVMSMLRMSFKPRLLHGGMLDASDIVNLLDRFEYWLDETKKNLNIIIVSNVIGDTKHHTTDELHEIYTKVMLGKLNDSWSDVRFHVAVLNQGMHWRCVLIDRVAKTFEYYDPLGNSLNIVDAKSPLASQVTALYKAVRGFDNGIKTLTSEKIRRGEHKHQRESTECGMYVILFIYKRVVEGLSFRQIINLNIPDSKCTQLRKRFFDIGQAVTIINKPKQKDYRIRYGNYDIRAAALDLLTYIQYVIKIIKDSKVREQLENDQQDLLDMLTKTNDYVQIRVKGSEIQQRLYDIMPNEFRNYSDNNIWIAIIQEITHDPLTVYLRNKKVKNKKGRCRGSNKKRADLMSNYFEELTQWKERGAPANKVKQFHDFTAEYINGYYVPVLQFSDDNKKRFIFDIAPEAFVRECAARQETVSFGVHFLRKIQSWVKSNMGVDPVHTGSDLYKYRVTSNIVRPFNVQNMAQMQNIINNCDIAMESARQLLQTTLEQQSQAKPIVRQNIAVMPTSFMTNNIVARITGLLQNDMENLAFMRTGIQPWYFPINVSSFNSSQMRKIHSRFNDYSVDESQMLGLIRNDTFRLYYTMEIMLISHAIVSGNLSDTHILTIVFMSLLQFYNAAYEHTNIQQFICVLMDHIASAARMQQELMMQMANFIQKSDLMCVNKQTERYSQYLEQVMQHYSDIRTTHNQ